MDNSLDLLIRNFVGAGSGALSAGAVMWLLLRQRVQSMNETLNDLRIFIKDVNDKHNKLKDEMNGKFTEFIKDALSRQNFQDWCSLCQRGRKTEMENVTNAITALAGKIDTVMHHLINNKEADER